MQSGEAAPLTYIKLHPKNIVLTGMISPMESWAAIINSIQTALLSAKHTGGTARTNSARINLRTI
jgi:hypothetical protein